MQLDDLRINSWTSPMHLFVVSDDDAAGESVCGLSAHEANNQDDDIKEPYEPSTFAASNNYETIHDLREHWHGDHHCSECAEVLEDSNDD